MAAQGKGTGDSSEDRMWLSAAPSLGNSHVCRRGQEMLVGLACLWKMVKGLCFTFVNRGSMISSTSLRLEDSEKALLGKWQENTGVLWPSVELRPGVLVIMRPQELQMTQRPRPCTAALPMTGMSSRSSVTCKFGEVLNCDPANMPYIPFLNLRNRKKVQTNASRRYCEGIRSVFNRCSPLKTHI